MWGGGGRSDNIRPALYAAECSAVLASRASKGQPMLCRVVGKHCEGGDILVRDVYLPSDLCDGDLIAVPASGAYSRSLASNYTHATKPPVVSVATGEVTTPLRRATHDAPLAPAPRAALVSPAPTPRRKSAALRRPA